LKTQLVQFGLLCFSIDAKCKRFHNATGNYIVCLNKNTTYSGDRFKSPPQRLQKLIDQLVDKLKLDVYPIT